MNPELYSLMRHQNDEGGGGEIETEIETDPTSEIETDPNAEIETDPAKAVDEFEGLDDQKVLEYLQSKKGTKAEKLEQILNADKALSGTTKKHQDAMTELKALRAALGEEYGPTLAKGMRGAASDEDDSGEFNISEPEHLKSFDDKSKKEIASTFDYHLKRNTPALIKQVVAGVKAFLDEEKANSLRGEVLPDYNDNQAIYDGIRQKYGITGNSKEALSLIKKIYEEEAESALSEGAEDIKSKAKPLGTPPPKPGLRTKTAIDTNFDDPEARKRRYQETTKRQE